MSFFETIIHGGVLIVLRYHITKNSTGILWN